MNALRKSVRYLTLISLIALILATAASAETVRIRFWSDGRLTVVERTAPANMSPPEAAVRALVAGPTEFELADGISTRIPQGASIVNLVLTETTAEIDLSAEVLAGLDESSLHDIFEQFRSTLGDFPNISSIKLTCGGDLLSSYLPAGPSVGQPAHIPSGGLATSATGLAGKKICVGPSHGRYWNSSYGWLYQRPETCGWGEEALEDTNSIRLVAFLKQYLVQDGATFTSPRQLDQSDCCHPDNGLPWWKMCAQSWLRHAGVPSSVWANYTGNAGGDMATDRGNDDIRARPKYADYVGADIYIAHHTNAGGGGTATGTETFRDTAMEHPEYETASYNLATAVHNSIIDTIRTTFPEEPNWANRGVKDGNGGYGEIRIPSRPAILIELAFHDDCARDAKYLTDDFFRSPCEWGIYKGICTYFGTTPTWDKYSCEYVSDTIPTTMLPGQSYNVSITFRNRGVCWFTSRGFRLGAVGGSDPLASFTRVDISGQVNPGNTYTFNFTLTAPSVGGTYTTDWQMVRDGYTWFGPTVSKNIFVSGDPDTEPPSVPQNLRTTSVTSSTVALAWDASTDNAAVNGYRVYRDGVMIGTSTVPSYTDSGLSSSSRYVYEVDAFDGASNYSAKSAPLAVNTAAGVATWGPNSDSECDTMLNSMDTPTDNHNASTNNVGCYSITEPWNRESRPLFHWLGTGVNTPLNPNIVTTGGTFTHTISNVYNQNPATIGAYMLSRGWPNNNYSDSNAMVSWVCYDYPHGLPWTTQGGDVDPVMLTSTSVTGTGVYNWTWTGIHNAGYGLQFRNLTSVSNIANRKTFPTNAQGRATLTLNYIPPSGEANSCVQNWNAIGTWPETPTSLTVANFSFETPTQPAAGFAYTPSGGSWTFDTAGVAGNGSPWYVPNAPQGSQAGFVQRAGYIEQSFTFPAAGLYTISFASVGRGGGLGPNPMKLKVDGVDVFSWTPGVSSWTTYNVPFTIAAPGNHTIRFQGTSAATDLSTCIDNVSINDCLGTDFLATDDARGVNEADMAASTGSSYNGQAFGVTSQDSDRFNAVTYGWGTECTGYGFVYVYYDHPTNNNVYVGVGSDDQFKLWINGQVVASWLAVGGRGWTSQDDTFVGPVTLKQGWNRVLIKVRNGVSAYGWSLRFANADRSALGNCTFALTDSTAPTNPTSCTDSSGSTDGIAQTVTADPNFTWSGAEDPETSGEGVSKLKGYYYYWGTDPNGTSSNVTTTAAFDPPAVSPGTYYLRVAAYDYALNTAEWQTIYTFKYGSDAPTYGITNKAAGDKIMESASANFSFTIWGKVTKIDNDSFTLDDGSGAPVEVIFAGHGLEDNDYASARGTLDVSGDSPVLDAQAVTKH